MKQVKPRALMPGARVGIIAPSSPVTASERVDAALDAVRKLGFIPVEAKSCRETRGYLAGSDALRAADLTNFFADDSIEGIFCLTGGYGVSRMLDLVNWDSVRAHPKQFVGFSDITALHLALERECGLVTLHGPMPHSNGLPAWNDITRERLLFCLGPEGGKGPLKNPGKRPLMSLVGGKAQGKLVGGNLALITATIGTRWEIDTRGKILFIEDVTERPYRVDRMLSQLRLAGKLDAAVGFILGDWNDCGPAEGELSLSLAEVLEDILLPLGKPTISELSAGHCEPNLTLPLGVEVMIDADIPRIEFLEAATAA